MTTPVGAASRAAAAPALALALALTGCASPATLDPPPTGPAASALPHRPLELSIAGLDPCALLGPAHQGKLGVHQISLTAGEDTMGGVDCYWNNDPAEPDNGYRVGVNTAHGAEWVLGKRSREEIVQVDGFTAVQTYGGLGDPEEQCILWIDVAAGQSLVVSYENHYHRDPAMNRALACQRARTAATLVLQTLRTTPR